MNVIGARPAAVSATVTPTGGATRACAVTSSGGGGRNAARWAETRLCGHADGRTKTRLRRVRRRRASPAHASAAVKTRNTARSGATREAHLDTLRISPPRQPSGRRMGGRPHQRGLPLMGLRLSWGLRRRHEQQVRLALHAPQVFSNHFQRCRRQLPLRGCFLQIRQRGQSSC